MVYINLGDQYTIEKVLEKLIGINITFKKEEYIVLVEKIFNKFKDDNISKDDINKIMSLAINALISIADKDIFPFLLELYKTNQYRFSIKRVIKNMKSKGIIK